MNYNENEDELERMKARSRRGASRSTGGPRPAARQTPPRRPAPSGVRTRERYEEEYDYDEEYGEEEYGRNTDGVYSAGNNADPYEYDAYEGGDDFEDIIIDDEPGNVRRADRPAGSRSGSARMGRSASAASKSQAGPARGKTKSSRRTRPQDDLYNDINGRSRDTGPRSQGQMGKRRKKKKWKGIILLLLAAFIGYGAWMFLHRPTGIWNVAVFGVDSRDGNTKNALADVQMICSIDRSTGEIKLVSVYRDTYLKINSEGTYHKINEAYFKGGQKQAVAALEENLDLKIDDYATFNWKSVAEAINILGGIDLEITPAEFEYINGFITETVNSTGIGSVQLTQAGMNHLDGVQAVAYSRLRLMDTDFQRTERQRKVVQLALEKAKQADVSTLTSLATYMIPQISTSVSANDVLPLVKDIKKFHIGETAGFPFSRQTKRVGKMDCVIPTTLESNVILLHQFLYGEETSYSPSSAVKKISAHISEETGLYEEGKAAPSGGTGGGSSGKNNTPAATAPAETAPPETQPTVESTEETQETTVEETESTEETQETEEPQEIGPGVSGKPSQTEENTEEETESPSGPGADDTPSSPVSDNPAGNPTDKPTPSPTQSTQTPAEPGTTPGSDKPIQENAGGPGEAGPGV